MVIRPNVHLKMGRNDYTETRPTNIKILDKTQTNLEPIVLLDEKVKNWADLIRKVIPVLRPKIDEVSAKCDFETIFNNAIKEIMENNDFKVDNNFSKVLYQDDSYITSERYKKSTNHKIQIMTNAKGEELYICAVYTCEVEIVLQALIDSLSTYYNIEILVDYKSIERQGIREKCLKQLINESNNIVFFGGAGVSTESGIPDFRSKDGLYNQQYDYPPEEILSHYFFMNHTDEFYQFYKDKMNCLNYEPNITHTKLAKLEKKGKLKAIITQNIDGLHQKAGSENVIELHGSVTNNYCMRCGKNYNAEYVFNSVGTPKCSCGGIIKPGIVLYQEGLNSETLEKAVNAIENADLLIVGGTSLAVHPACDLIDYFKGDNIVLINKSLTPYDLKANLVIHKNLGQVFNKI